MLDQTVPPPGASALWEVEPMLSSGSAGDGTKISVQSTESSAVTF